MSDLSPRAREVLRSGVKPPTLADRQRILSALHARLGTAVPVAKPSALAPAISRWSLISGAIVGLGLIGGALYLMTRHEPEASPPLITVGPSASAIDSSVPVPVSAPPLESATIPAPAISAALDAPDQRSHPAPDRLAQEVSFMERATAALHAGHAAAALKVLDEYQRRFPNGSLTLERRAARAQALCSLGRSSEAQQELAALPARSLGVARAKQVCDAASNAAH